MADSSLSSCIATWDKGGRSNLTSHLKSLLTKNEVQIVASYLQKLANNVLTQDSTVTVEAYVGLIGELLKCLESRTVLEIKIADVLWCCESLIQLSNPQINEKFHRLISQSRCLVSDGLLKERLSEDILESCQLIPTTRQQFLSRYVKTKTRLFYKQHKFNLLREEGEGYAKLATELTEFEPSNRDHYAPEIDQLLRLIKSLIGCFDLDPNRVLDLILDVCESRLDHIDFFIPLIERYASDRIDLCHSIGHKFQFYEQDIATTRNLYAMTARLLQAGLISLKTLYPHLSPSDSKNAKLHEIAAEMELKKKRKNTSAFDLPPLPDGLPSIDQKNSADNEPSDMEQSADTVLNYDELFGNHQKLGLCEALIVLGDWENARPLLDRFEDPTFPTSHPPLRKSLCNLLHWMIDCVYEQCNPLPADLIKSRRVPAGNYSNLRQPQDVTDLVRKTFPIAYVLGSNMHCDQRLLVKFIRISQAYLAQANVGKAEKVDPVYQGIFNLLDYVILPSLSMIDANCVLAEEIWQTLQHMPYDHRYRLFSQWKNVKASPALTAKRTECLNRTKYIVKRLTKDNVKLMGRQLGKLCHSNPCVVFDYVLNSIQRYDNLIGPIVEACKYMSLLSYDVFMYCVIEQLAASDRLKFEDLQFSLWFQHICNMTGQMCKRYQCDLTGVIQFVLNQLKLGSSYDLLLLRELMHKMTGIEVTEEVTADQLEAMMGGELLRQEGGYYNQIRNTRKNSQRIKQVLVEHDLALPCLFLMARHREGLVFREGEGMHLKLCGKLHDQCQDTLVQFGVFMGLNGDEMQCPPLGELVTDYHVPVDVAFFILRSNYRAAIARRFDERRSELGGADGPSQEEVLRAYLAACRAVTSSAVEQIRPLHSAKVWEELTPHFYVLFWSLQASDLSCPKAAYERQLLALHQQVLALDRDKVLSESKRKKEKERLRLLEERLSQEQKQLQEHVGRVMHRLRQEKDTWFQMRTKTDTITQFLQLCVYPRLAFTTRDALFAAKFIHVLHTLKTPNFSTLICFDRIFNDITLPMTNCTENEAHRYGRFLCAILDLIMRWHNSQEVYNPECSTYPGFVTVFRKGADSNTKADQLEYENYRHVVHKWHYRITKSTVACLESGSYLQIRNTLIVLIRIMVHYPRIIPFGQALERRLEKLIEEEKDKRKDLHALALSYHGKLKLVRTSWVPDYDFHIKDECTAAAAAAASGAIAAAAPSQGPLPAKRKLASTAGPAMPPPAASNGERGPRPAKATSGGGAPGPAPNQGQGAAGGGGTPPAKRSMLSAVAEAKPATADGPAEGKRRRVEAHHARPGAQQQQQPAPAASDPQPSKRAGAANGRASASPKEEAGGRSQPRPAAPADADDARRPFKAPAGGERRTVLLSEARAASGHHHASGAAAGARMRHGSPQGHNRPGASGDAEVTPARPDDEEEAEGLPSPAGSSSARRTARAGPGKGRASGGSGPKEGQATGSGNSLLAPHAADKRAAKDKDGHAPQGGGAGAWNAKHHSRSRSNPRK